MESINNTPHQLSVNYDHLAPQDRPSAPPLPPPAPNITGQKRGRDSIDETGASQKRAQNGLIPPQ